MKTTRFLSPVILALALTACVKDKPAPAPEPSVPASPAPKVYIINEGNFGTGNASISMYDTGLGQVSDDVFKETNNEPLGDVAQSVAMIDGKFYIAVNNSGKIVVCDKKMKKLGEIGGLPSPRYVTAVNGKKAYVSDFKANGIHIIDLDKLEKTGFIPCGGWTEGMVKHKNRIFVCNMKRDYVYVIDTDLDKITDSVNVGAGSSSIVVDGRDRLWVLCPRDYQTNEPASLSVISANTQVTERTMVFDAAVSPGNLLIDQAHELLFFVAGGVYKMPLSATTLPAAPLIPQSGRNYYGAGLHASGEEIYVSDALDYVQRSNVYIFGYSGEGKKMFKAGINAGSFYFD